MERHRRRGVHSFSSEGRPSFSTWYLESEVGLSTFQPTRLFLMVRGMQRSTFAPQPAIWPSRPLVGKGIECSS